MKLDDAINSRCSCREFNKKGVKWEKILDAIDSSSKIPFAGNINNLQFIIVENKETKNKLAEHSQQHWIADAPFIIVVCSDEGRLEKLYNERGKIYSRQQAGAAIQNLLLKLTDLKLSACWVGAYSDELIKQLLKIPGHINIEALIPVGNQKKATKKCKKLPLESLINWEIWGVKKKPSFFKDSKTR